MQGAGSSNVGGNGGTTDGLGFALAVELTLLLLDAEESLLNDESVDELEAEEEDESLDDDEEGDRSDR